MYGYIGKIQRAKQPFSPPSSPDSFTQQDTPDLAGDNGTLTSPSSTSSLPPSAIDSPPAANQAIRKLYNIASRVPSSSSHTNLRRLSNSIEPESASGSQFDSLHDLLERAGYRETRVITPDRSRLVEMASKLTGTPPTADDKPKPKAIPPSSSSPSQGGSPSQAALTLRKTMQRACSDTTRRPPERQLRSTKSAGWLFGAFWRSNPTPSDAPPLPFPVPSIRIDVPSETAPAPALAPEPESRKSFNTPPRTASASDQGSGSHTRTLRPPASPKRTLRRQTSRNQLWTGSLAYRQSKAKANTAPVRGLVSPLSVAAGTDTIAAADAFFEQINAARKGKRRPGLVDAFKEDASPAQDVNASPTKQRRLRRERNEWKESLSGLESLQSKPAPATVPAPAPAPAPASSEVNATATPSAVPHLLSKPALPFLTTDPAVVLRNESCLRPAHLSVKRMKSVESLSRALHSSPPTPVPEPPRLVLTSPTGVHSPQTIALDGTEFEPRSWPKNDGQTVLISSRKVKVKRKRPLAKKSINTPPPVAAPRPAAGAGAGAEDDPFSQRDAKPAKQFVVRGQSRMAKILGDENAGPVNVDSPTRSRRSRTLA